MTMPDSVETPERKAYRDMLAAGPDLAELDAEYKRRREEIERAFHAKCVEARKAADRSEGYDPDAV